MLFSNCQNALTQSATPVNNVKAQESTNQMFNPQPLLWTTSHYNDCLNEAVVCHECKWLLLSVSSPTISRSCVTSPSSFFRPPAFAVAAPQSSLLMWWCSAVMFCCLCWWLCLCYCTRRTATGLSTNKRTNATYIVVVTTFRIQIYFC